MIKSLQKCCTLHNNATATMTKNIIILHNKIEQHTQDELDVLEQRDLVARACQQLGYKVSSMEVGHHIYDDISKVQAMQADVVFNLVESSWGKGELLHVVPSLLNALKIPYTGVPLEALFISTNKVLAKRIMRLHHLPTADFFAMDELHLLDATKTYIVKPIWEEASVGIDAHSVFTLADSEKVEQLAHLSPKHYFVEEYIEGREFNISMLNKDGRVEVLPPAEMLFSSYFTGKPKVVGYKAKWDENSEEYQQTNRAFDTLEKQPLLKQKLEQVCIDTWKAFNLSGYARVDFRVDNADNIYILEINGNPCIAPDSGFVAAIQHTGYTLETMVERIIQDTN